MTSGSMKVAFVGLGTMGGPMAACLRQGGVSVAGWDALAATREPYAFCAATVGEAIHDANAVVTMLPTGADVADVYRTHVFNGGRKGTLLVDCSTIDVATTRLLATQALDHRLEMIDAPVSGGAEGARQGTLSFMVGGSEIAIARAKPLLDIMGKSTSHFGPSGNGQAAKACHNMICGITALGVCEAFALADALGLDSDKFFELCNGAAAQSWILENRCPVPGPAPAAPSSNGYAPGFAARLMAKDLRLAQEAAATCGQKTMFGELAAKRFTDFAEAQDGDLDFSAIYRTIR